LPIVGRPWQYAFFIDVMFDDYELFVQVIDVLKKAVTELKILGVYNHNIKNVPSQLTKVLINGK
jgi:prephenate dehydratase